MTEAKFVKLLEKKFKEQGYLTKKEVGVGYGIADLVLFKLDPKKCAIRSAHKQFTKLDSTEYFRILDQLPENKVDETIDINYLENALKISKKTLKYKYLRKLEDGGFIRLVEGKCYLKINGWMPMAKEIIAIEAKLKDWKKGFFQANRYKSFAHKSYLALPMDRGRLVDMNLLKKYNVGLILFDVNTENLVFSNIKKEKPLNDHKFNLASEFVVEKRILNQSFA